MNLEKKTNFMFTFSPIILQSFTSKAALLGHTRIHCIGRSINSGLTVNSLSGVTSVLNNGNLVSKDDFPCKVCGK